MVEIMSDKAAALAPIGEEDAAREVATRAFKGNSIYFGLRNEDVPDPLAGDIIGGDYTFKVGTAGSCTLVLQTVLPALLSAAGESTG